MADKVFPINSAKTAWNSTVSPSWEITQQKSASGRTRAMCNQYYPSYTYSVTFNCLNNAELDTLLGFYNQCKGSLVPFFYKDYLHSKVEKATVTNTDSTDGGYLLTIPRGDYLEPCQKVDNVKVYINDVETTNFSVVGGAIYFSSTPVGTVKASYEYYVKVRFNNSIKITEMFFNANKVTVSLISAR